MTTRGLRVRRCFSGLGGVVILQQNHDRTGSTLSAETILGLAHDFFNVLSCESFD